MSDGRLVARARTAGVRDRRVLDALGAVDRRRFVPLESVDGAAVDAPIPLPCSQTTSQPSLIALMVEALETTPTDRVLEIGTGYGFEAAVLARLVDQVWTIEWWPELADQARQNLSEAGVSNVHVLAGDGHLGLPDLAPFDGIIVAARCDVPPRRLGDQLTDTGRLVLPLGPEGAEQLVVMAKRADGQLVAVRSLGRVRFVPLLGP